MAELTIGSSVTLINGDKITIESELGRGGQGVVYEVTHNGTRKALKWYTTCPSDKFYSNLVANAKAQSPSKFFLWPECVTVKENGSLGYVMPLRPKGYYEFSGFLLARYKFDSVMAMTVAAMEMCEAFKSLHAQGLSYQDLNDGNFFIDPHTGHVLICDNDNVFPHKEKSGIMGKARYMAPEVVIGKSSPDAHSDKFSLAVILFLLFFANHPFEGARVHACPCMTEENEKKFYGEEITFVMDSQNTSNRPVKGVHNNVIRRWGVFPEKLKNAFVEEFSKEKLAKPQSRRTELEWLELFTKLRDELILCPHCGEETFVQVGKSNVCADCGKPIDIQRILEIEGRKLVLTLNNKLYFDRDEIPDALVVAAPAGSPDPYFIRNISPTDWHATTRSGRLHVIAANGGEMPTRPGLSVSFGKFNKKGVIK